MKIPSIPLAVIYKIVQRFNGKLYSYNQVIHDLRNEPYKDVMELDEVVEYPFEHQVFPSTGLKALFACATKKDAIKLFQGIGRADIFCIIQCYGFNVREVDNLSLFLDSAVMPVKDKIWVTLPSGVRTVLCDWLIPISIVN